MIDAEVTIKFVVDDICEDEDMEDACLLDLVQEIIDDQGLWELIVDEDNFEVIDAKRIG